MIVFTFFLKFIICVFLVNLSIDFLKFVPIVLPLLFSIAFFTVIERKILASIQRRRGPNMVGLYGLYKLLLML
jgi:NADH:ubiquinone oxidoreductase subunit H